ncbi:enoyl-CoA hydratase-related protein [Georgenia thermotolerans]|uniref:Enoyl-CoA hydratase n=1 Tax=Georgenia thermotolerans TaxID=527326 RepID=A0A7J5UTH1_9MICO|nr:enoyl-CoA hydratase-related protein [Georgenia thermotolerans]KAE8765570.1 enoyl-CoA hydratase [Georgenia thermotolerans]
MDAEVVHLATSRGVATITLDSPANRNALSRSLRARLGSRFAAALADPAVRVVVLTHTGPVFCAGADLAAGGAGVGGTAAADAGLGGTAPTGSDDVRADGVPDLPRLIEMLWHSPKPVIARLAGTARGGGVGLVAACDLAVAADTVAFAFPEVRLGVVPAVVSAPLRRRVAPHALHELFLTGEAFDARRAVAIGLLTAAVAAEALDAEVRRYADLLVRGGPDALAATKALLREAPTGPLTAVELTGLGELSARHFASVEGQEGVRARAERREAAWVPPPLDEP